MNTSLFVLALLEIVLSLVVSVIIIFVSYKIMKRLFFASEDVKGHNMAFSIFTSGVVLSIGIILSEILPTITNVIRVATTQPEAVDSFQIVQYSLLYLGIGFLISILINASVFLLFSILTRGINEFKAIQQNNVAVAILVTAILISITLIIKDGISLLISSLVPYPEVSNFL
ncbi:DUF350 domain-containing protein [Altibacter sp. HG106]|uniref:DUF350 domain-containing protein n=1 Tax=Altibacter sp. HG106 TaxID=3023937 RepID=UPI002350B869|nr:DUF350 domain-containing protein [Altibacter sp. HG106]MDC7995265.1 DUF350 domain-containing protein [Altibacter sp. HG106]